MGKLENSRAKQKTGTRVSRSCFQKKNRRVISVGASTPTGQKDSPTHDVQDRRAGTRLVAAVSKRHMSAETRPVYPPVGRRMMVYFLPWLLV